MSEACLGEFVPERVALRLLGIKHRATLAKVRKAHPDVFVVLPGMAQRRYIVSRLVKLARSAVKKAE